MGGFASNGYGALSPGRYSMAACLVAEFLLTFFFLMIIISTTSKGAATGFAGIAIGLPLTLIRAGQALAPEMRTWHSNSDGKFIWDSSTIVLISGMDLFSVIWAGMATVPIIVLLGARLFKPREARARSWLDRA